MYWLHFDDTRVELVERFTVMDFDYTQVVPFCVISMQRGLK